MSASTERKNRASAIAAGTDRKTIAQREADRKAAKSKRRWTVSAIAIIAAIAIVIFLSCSNFLYTSTTALKVDDEKYSPAEVQYYLANSYYNFASNYGSYASIFGLDTSYGISGLSSQECTMLGDGATWADYFGQSAVEQIAQIQFLCQYADENGLTLDEDDQATIEENFTTMESYAEENDMSLAQYIRAYFGQGVTQKVARECMEKTSLASKAYNAYLDSLTYTDDELEEAYQALDGADDEFTYLYYTVAAETESVTAEDGTTSDEVTDATLAAADETAQKILDAYNSGFGANYENRLNNAIAEVMGEGTCSSNTTQGSSLSSVYSDFLMGDGVSAGDAEVADGSSSAYVVVFMNRDDNHYATAQVRHILIKAEADEDGNYTDEAKAAAEARAEEILAEWQENPTEENFAALAEEYSEDTGSNTNGGLYDSIAKDQTVEEFNDFCFADHEYGDTAIVYGESSSYCGYHIMFYVGEGELYSNVLARDSLQDEALTTWLDEGAEAQTVSYDTYAYNHFVVK